MKRRIRLTEGDLHRIVKESVNNVLKELNGNSYNGNDLTHDSIKMQAEHIITQMEQKGQPIHWRNVAEQMGLRLDTLNGEDMELLKDTIEEAMLENSNQYYKEDADFLYDFNKLSDR